jgi:hypothetical protein
LQKKKRDKSELGHLDGLVLKNICGIIEMPGGLFNKHPRVSHKMAEHPFLKAIPFFKKTGRFGKPIWYKNV